MVRQNLSDLDKLPQRCPPSHMMNPGFPEAMTCLHCDGLFTPLTVLSFGPGQIRIEHIAAWQAADHQRGTDNFHEHRHEWRHPRFR